MKGNMLISSSFHNYLFYSLGFNPCDSSFLILHSSFKGTISRSGMAWNVMCATLDS